MFEYSNTLANDIRLSNFDEEIRNISKAMGLGEFLLRGVV